MCMNETGKTKTLMDRIARWRTNLIWIVVVFIALYVFVCGIACIPWDTILLVIKDRVSGGFFHIMGFYTYNIISILILFLLTWLIRSDRYIWKSFLLPRKPAEPAADESDILADYYGRGRNSFKMLGWGALIGCLTNGFAIACALIHGDIKLYFESSVRQIPLLLFALFSVGIQSASEEMWCRGYLYERIHERYPLWVAVAVNGILFGALHAFNKGASVYSVLQIAVCGISYSLLRWYAGNIWIVIGAHTAWNYTQAFLFGLPNSGLVSEISVFHLDASTGISNLFYDFAFGVESCLPALFVDTMIGVVVIILAARSGRLKELKMNRVKAMGETVTDQIPSSSKV